MTDTLNPDALIIGQISLSFHGAAAALISEILTDLGHSVEVREAPHEEMFRMQGRGEVDLLCSAWLPSSHQVYLTPYQSEVLTLGVIYTPYCLWSVPTDAPGEIRSVEDLARPEIARRFRKRIQGINPGAGISRFSRQMVYDYGLAAQGFHFENGTLDDCTGAYLDALAAGELAVIPLWQPQWLHLETDLRELTDPKGLLGGQDEATLVLRRDAKAKLSDEGLRFLQKVSPGNAVISAIDHAMCRQGLAPREAARAWIDAHGDVVRQWLD
ncbi:MAG: glycine betaine ABC transporter substrate-binding protein [Pseudomonadota bacterium]